MTLSGEAAGPSTGPFADTAGRLEFIEIDDPRVRGTSRDRPTTGDAGATPPSMPAPPAAEPGWNLWGDLEG